VTADVGTFDAIVADVDSRDWQTRLSAVEKLGTLNDPRKVNVLLKVADTYQEYWPVKIKAMLLLGDTRDPRAIEVLLSVFNDAFLNNECPSIKSHAAIALGNFNADRRVVDALITGIEDRELLTREASVRSLGKIKNPRAVPHLIPVLRDHSAAMRLSAVWALEEIGDPQAVPHLRTLADTEKDPDVKRQAEVALQNFSSARRL
jgi:HEAT repeat protein